MLVRVDLIISLDGFASTTDQTPEKPFGEDWGRLTADYVATRTFRQRVFHDTSGVRAHVLEVKKLHQLIAQFDQKDIQVSDVAPHHLVHHAGPHRLMQSAILHLFLGNDRGADHQGARRFTVDVQPSDEVDPFHLKPMASIGLGARMR